MRILGLITLLPLVCFAQRAQGGMSAKERAALVAKRESIEKQLEDIAVIDRKVMVPMRDGVRMQADIYRPKDTSKQYPVLKLTSAMPTH